MIQFTAAGLEEALQNQYPYCLQRGASGDESADQHFPVDTMWTLVFPTSLMGQE
jgi:hypothetical protein